MKGFYNFIREQGVIGLAVGFILGTSISKVVTSLVTDIIYPLLSFVLGRTKGLEKEYFPIGKAKVLYGHFLSVLIDFLIVAIVIYAIVKLLRVDKIHKKIDL